MDRNLLLASLPDADRQRWVQDLELVELPLGCVLYEAGDTLQFAYFPRDCIISLLYVMKNGASAEIAVIGSEGMVGMPLFLGGESTSSRAIVQNAGSAYRMKATAIRSEFATAAPVLHILLRFTQALIAQMTQTAACNKHHALPQQLCRWLLLSLDRLQGKELVMTQQLVANMLGVPVERLSEGADTLQLAGLIRIDGKRITVLDREGLERSTCECYRVVRREYDRLLPRGDSTVWSGNVIRSESDTYEGF